MADELTVSISTSLRDGDVTTSQSSTAVSTPTTKKAISKSVTVTTTAAALDFTGLTTARYVEIKNLDPTNYVDLGPDNGGTMLGGLRLKPGDALVMPLKPSVTWKWQANTASCVVQMTAFDA